MKRSRDWRSSLKFDRLVALLLTVTTVFSGPVSLAQDEAPPPPDDEAIEFVEPPPPPPPDGGEDMFDAGQDPNMGDEPGANSRSAQGDSGAPSNSASRRSSSSSSKGRGGNSQAKGNANANAAPTSSRKIQSLDFKDTPIEEVIRAISQLTGKNFILDPAVKGRISIMAPTAVTVDEAYQAFLSALAINGYTVVPSGKFLKIMQGRSALRDSVETKSSRVAPTSDQMVTRIIKLNHISVADVNRYMRTIVSKDGDLIGYDPTNSLIITDYGSNIRRILKIIDSLDKAGFEERMAVIPIRFAKAKDLAGLIEKVIGKGGNGGPGNTRFGAFPSRGIASVGGEGKGISLSLVTPDDRTNSLVVLGNQEGIDKIRTLVEELDFNLDPGQGGGVFVYRLKHSVAETVATTLNGLAQKAGGAAAEPVRPGAPPPPPQAGALFGGDVKIVADKNTNSLIVVAAKQDFDTVRGLLSKIDIPRDQVYVEAIIMELNTEKTRNWNLSGYYLDPATKGIGRAGFGAAGTLLNILNPTNDSGAVLSFGSGRTFTAKIGDTEFQVPSLLAFVNLLKTHADGNILSTPQILAMDNEEAMIEVGDQVPIGIETQTTPGGVQNQSPRFEKATIKLTITPNISPESATVRMKVDQSVRQASEKSVRAARLADISTIISDRTLKTNIVVEDQDTVVLGGLIRDEETRSETKIPFLGDIPVLGWLFKTSNVRKAKVNLLVFLTPKIVRNPEDSRRLLGSKINDRNGWVKENLVGPDPFVEKIQSMLQAPPRQTPAPAPAPAPAPLTPAKERAPANAPQDSSQDSSQIKPDDTPLVAPSPTPSPLSNELTQNQEEESPAPAQP